MDTARFKVKPGAVMLRNHRILCGKFDGDGVQRCRGELGGLVVEVPLGRYIVLHPLVNAAMARDSQGHYRLSRQRRPFRSGVDGTRHLGAGMAHAMTAFHVQDQGGMARKWLPALTDVAGQDEITLVCPRCARPNAVTHAAFVAYLERVAAPV